MSHKFTRVSKMFSTADETLLRIFSQEKIIAFAILIPCFQHRVARRSRETINLGLAVRHLDDGASRHGAISFQEGAVADKGEINPLIVVEAMPIVGVNRIRGYA